MTREEKIATACELRASTDLSLKKIGEQLGVSHTTVRDWTEHLRPSCAECEVALQVPADDELCGFCREEAVVALRVAIARQATPTVEQILAVLLPPPMTELESDRSVHA